MDTKDIDYWKACNEFASTTDMHKINEAVYSGNKFALVCVMDNPLLSQDHLSHLLEHLNLPEDRITILSHPNFSATALNQLDLEREEVSVCRFLLKNEAADFKTRLSANMNINRPILIRL